ncbi:MAG: hypothetical protein ACHQJ4_00485 [Ignavibacteria bacterium]
MKINIKFIFTALFLFIFSINSQDTAGTYSYVKSLKEKGSEPIQFVLKALDVYDLIIFDDANHSAAEPFEFYQKLISDTAFQNKVRYIFIEAFSLSKQHDIDNYMNSETEDRTLLYPVFQDDFSGLGWTYETYFNLMHTIYTVNKSLPPEKKFKVIGVSNATYWSAVRTTDDLALFRVSLASFDYTMYMRISGKLDDFNSGRKGIFLTNTRHSYKGIKDSKGNLYWNCGTFFHQWNPGKTYSIRIHNATLYIEKEVDSPDKPKTTEGMENIQFKWLRIAGGKWDEAFRLNGNVPVAITLEDTPFGKDPYVGNHMLDALPGQTMYDANDAIIFLAPLNELHRSAITNEIYTNDFKKELERRMNLLYTPDKLNQMLVDDSVKTIREYIDKEFIPEPEILLPQAQDALKN